MAPVDWWYGLSVQYDDRDAPYQPMMSAAEARRRIGWQERIYREHLKEPEAAVEFLGRRLVVPRDVLQPAPLEFNLMAATVLKEVRATDAVLDMGSGSGVQAILAASKSSRVVAVDVNPAAVRCTRHNAALNGVADRIEARRSDLYRNVRERFDLILFDPPFRWTAPRDAWERASADEGYATLRAFLLQSKQHLKKTGRIIIHFGTSGDVAYLKRAIRKNGFRRQQLLKISHPAGWEYFTYRLTC
jgi:release factor glutamine methyltransferase